MAKTERATMCLGLTALLMILMGISSAQPVPQPEGPIEHDLVSDRGCSLKLMQHGDGMQYGEGMPPMGVPVEMIVGGGGFALKGNETHLLRLSIVRLSPLEPGRVIDLLISNKSVEEIRKAIKAEEGQSIYKGSMRMDDIDYMLTDIEVRPLEDNANATIVDANIAPHGSDSANQTSTVGHLNMTVSVSKGGRIGEGQIEIDCAEHEGRYQVLLDIGGHEMHFKEMRVHMRSGEK